MIGRFNEPIGTIVILIDDKGNGQANVTNNYIPIQKEFVVRDWCFTVNVRLSYRIKVDKLMVLHRIENTVIRYSPIEY
jgi:hypothetical protein